MSTGLPRIGDSPDTVASADAGGDTQWRFEYQNTYTCIPILLMCANRSLWANYEHILCEYHEDILAKSSSGKFHGYQVKTKENGEFTLSDPEIIKSLARFATLDATFPGYFEEFFLVTNRKLRNKNSKTNILNLLSLAKRGQSAINAEGVDKYVKAIATKSGLSEGEVVSTLAKVSSLTGPSMDDVDSVVYRHFLAPICKGIVPNQIEKILAELISLIRRSAEGRIEEAAMLYVTANSDGLQQAIVQKIGAKRITRQMIEAIIQKHSSPDYKLHSRKETLGVATSGTVEVLRSKMNRGEIEKAVVENMEDLVTSAEHYIFENSYRDENDPYSLKSRLGHVEEIIYSLYLEARSRTKTPSIPFGTKLLQELEDRIRAYSDSKPADVRHCPYLILKGFVGILTKDCKISFTDEVTISK